MVSLDALERAEVGEGVARIERTEGSGAALRLSDLSVTLDTGKAVVKDAEVDYHAGRARAGGRGNRAPAKAPWLRAISGLWPWGEGGVQGRQRCEDVPNAATRLRSGGDIASCRNLSRAGG